jgi:hypothetical protein
MWYFAWILGLPLAAAFAVPAKAGIHSTQP